MYFGWDKFAVLEEQESDERLQAYAGYITAQIYAAHPVDPNSTVNLNHS